MSAGCHDRCTPSEAVLGRARKLLWIALALNAAMFAVEIGAGLAAGSVSLQADALDFLGDSASYAISLFVLARSARWRAGTAMLKGVSMAGFGLWVAGAIAWSAIRQHTPDAAVMGSVGALALVVNVAVALMLFSLRDGDANLRSVWLCSRNDALGNVAVLLAAAGVFGTGTAWPDLVVAALMAGLALHSAVAVLRQAAAEWRAAGALQSAS